MTAYRPVGRAAPSIGRLESLSRATPRASSGARSCDSEAVPAKDDDATVSFPATETFARLGRVTTSGLALRLGLDIARVERLRTAIDLAVAALAGDGRISVRAHWHEDFIELTVSNPDAIVDNTGGSLTVELNDLVDQAVVAPTEITLALQ